MVQGAQKAAAHLRRAIAYELDVGPVRRLGRALPRPAEARAGSFSRKGEATMLDRDHSNGLVADISWTRDHTGLSIASSGRTVVSLALENERADCRVSG